MFRPCKCPGCHSALSAVLQCTVSSKDQKPRLPCGADSCSRKCRCLVLGPGAQDSSVIMWPRPQSDTMSRLPLANRGPTHGVTLTPGLQNDTMSLCSIYPTENLYQWPKGTYSSCRFGAGAQHRFGAGASVDKSVLWPGPPWVNLRGLGLRG